VNGNRPPRGAAYAINQYYDLRVMWFRPITGVPPDGSFPLSHSGGGVPGFAENGGAYLLVGATTTLAFSSYFGSHFNLVSVDLAEWSVVEHSPVTVSFNGIKADGSVVSTSFMTDGVIDGTGPLPDFQTFYFDSQFRDLIRVESPSWGYAIDNVRTTNVVPEPASGVLLGLGLLGIRFLRQPLRTGSKTCSGPVSERHGDLPIHAHTVTPLL
jgi:hypothetical protein